MFGFFEAGDIGLGNCELLFDLDEIEEAMDLAELDEWVDIIDFSSESDLGVV